MTGLRPLLATAGVAMLLASPSGAVSGRAATFVEPTHLIAQYQYTEWSDAVRARSGGEIDLEVFTGGSLLAAQGILDGVASGVAQVGHVASAYFPSQLPIANALGDMGFVEPDPFVLGFAYADFMMNEKIGYDDWRRNGVIFGINQTTPAYNYLCRDEVRTLADLNGKRVRTPGGGWARISQAFGMVPVNIASSEMYTALERGAVDCVAADPSYLTTGPKLIDLVDTVLMLPISPVYTSAGVVFEPAFWQGLTADQRRLLLDEAAGSMVRLQLGYDREVTNALKAAGEAGIEIVEPDPTLRQAYDDWVAGGIGGSAELAREQYGVEDPDALFETFTGYIEKWSAILDGVSRDDEEGLVAALRTNLFDKIDVETYGMD